MPQVFPHQEPAEPAAFGTTDAGSIQWQCRRRLRMELATAIGKVVFLVGATVALLAHHNALLAASICLAGVCAVIPRALASRSVRGQKRLAAGGSCQVIRLVRDAEGALVAEPATAPLRETSRIASPAPSDDSGIVAVDAPMPLAPATAQKARAGENRRLGAGLARLISVLRP